MVPEFRPPVGVLIPAYNEEDVIVGTVRAALEELRAQPAGESTS